MSTLKNKADPEGTCAPGLEADCFEVQGLSMRRLLRPGDQIRVERAAPESLRAGDVVLFLAGPGADGARARVPLRVHRLLWKRRSAGGWLLLTKGDACARPDAWTPAGSLAGRVVAVRRPGGSWEELGGLRHRLVGASSTAWFLALGPARAAVAALQRSLAERRGAGARAARRGLTAAALWLDDA